MKQIKYPHAHPYGSTIKCCRLRIAKSIIIDIIVKPLQSTAEYCKATAEYCRAPQSTAEQSNSKQSNVKQGKAKQCTAKQCHFGSKFLGVPRARPRAPWPNQSKANPERSSPKFLALAPGPPGQSEARPFKARVCPRSNAK